MIKYSAGATLDWFHRSLGVNNQPHEDEVQTNCPMCGSKKLYFNVRKGVGVCHSASCEWHEKVFLKDLIELVGFAPDQGGEWEAPEVRGEVRPEKLPGRPLLWNTFAGPMTYHIEGLNYLRSRGITCDEERIYVPIRDVSGVLVNYNSRVLPGFEYFDATPKYLYYPGAKTGNYILGWQESRDWEDLALVENTFVSLAYRNRMHCSTTFGSNISNVQADLIAESGIRRVSILWDENAEMGADRALKKLTERGVKCAYWCILGQPDDYPTDWVAEKLEEVKMVADDGDYYLDLRSECQTMRDCCELKNDIAKNPPETV
jgi:hypothetical protein